MPTPHSSLIPGPRYQSMDRQATVKAVYFDVDNTLVPNESPALPSSRFTRLARAIGDTIPVALITARPLPKAIHILDNIDSRGISVLSNGAQLYDSRTRKIVAEWPIPISISREIGQKLLALGIHYWINDDGTDYVLGQPYSPHKPFVIVAHNVQEAQIAQVQSLAATYAAHNITSLVAHETREADDNQLFDVFILDRRANKLHALQTALSIQGLDISQVMAVGDGHNDADLVAGAGIGVAMSNSATKTLEAASVIAPDQSHDGAAAILEWLVSKKPVTP